MMVSGVNEDMTAISSLAFSSKVGTGWGLAAGLLQLWLVGTVHVFFTGVGFGAAAQVFLGAPHLFFGGSTFFISVTVGFEVAVV